MSEDKIFIISLHRVMTRSTDALLSMLGFRTLHFPKFFQGRNLMDEVRGLENNPDGIVDVLTPLIEHFDSLSDVPIPTLYRQLAERWPTSRFIFVHRDPEGWIRSVRNHLRSRTFSPYNRIQYSHYLGPDVDSLDQVGDDQLLDMYFSHLYGVHQYFIEEQDPGRLCMVSMHDLEIGEKIAKFLGRAPLPMPRIAGRPSADELDSAQQWVNLCPDKSDARYYLAQNLIAAGNDERAKAELRCACQSEPDQPKPFMLLSEILTKEGAFIESAEAAAKAVDAGLHRPKLCYRAAGGRLCQGRIREALSFFGQGLQRRLASR